MCLCVAVFGMLLGDTLVVDTLDDANAYRQEVSLLEILFIESIFVPIVVKQ